MASLADGRAGEDASRAPDETGTLRFVLRDATDAAHRRLDAGFAAYDLTRRADYIAFLTTMYAAVGPIEAWLDGIDARFLPPDWPVRRRGDTLRADLAGLGVAPAEAPRGIVAASLAGAEAPGMLYVLEGSRLGGQVLLRQVLASPDPLVGGNTRFLRHGEGQRLWPSYAGWLADRPASEHPDAIRGARRAFAVFEAAQAAG